jgi:2-oxoglutarate ferredoxin oxidoreductase subunit beta
LMAEQIEGATAKQGAGDLEALLHGSETWTVDSPN